MDNYAECLRVIRHTQQAYPDSISEQEAEVDRVLNGAISPCIILTEHPPLFTMRIYARNGICTNMYGGWKK